MIKSDHILNFLMKSIQIFWDHRNPILQPLPGFNKKILQHALNSISPDFLLARVHHIGVRL